MLSLALRGLFEIKYSSPLGENAGQVTVQKKARGGVKPKVKEVRPGFNTFAHLTNTVPYFTRKTLAHFMEQGFWERHLKKMRNIYKKKYDACIASLKKIPEGSIQFNNAPSGLNILLCINTRLSEREVIRRALDAGIQVTPASGCYYEKANVPRQPEVLLEFGSLPQGEIDRVVEKLYKAWFKIDVM